MKKMTLLSLLTATLVFTACGEDTKTTEVAAKAKAERVIELEKMAANKIAAKAAEKVEVAQIRAAEKAAAKAKEKAEKEAAELAKREAEVKAAAEKAEKEAAEALKETNATVTDASIIEAANKEIKVTH